MDGFNPLDLLASAAELQQKHEDGPERIIITRQWRSNASKTSISTSGQKENRELSNNNNNISKNKPSVVIVKKIRRNDVNPELEKMLDEHNYGNAKRNLNKIDKGSGPVLEISEGKRKEISLDDCSTPEQCVQTSTTEEQNKDKGSTVASNSISQSNDSECIHLVKCTDKNLCSNSTCTCKQENTEIKYDCQDLNGGPEHTGVVLNKSDENILNGNKKSHTLSRTPDKLITKYDKQYSHGNTSFEKTDLLTSCTEDGLELDEQTGEFKTKDGSKFIKFESISEKGDNQDRCSDSELSTEIGLASQVTTGTVSTPVAKKIAPDQNTLSSVKVGPADVVISNTGGQNSGNKITQETVSIRQNSTDSNVEGKRSDLGLNKSLLAENKLSERNDDNSGNKKKPVLLSIRPSKAELQHFNSTDSCTKSASCDSLKDFDITDPLCTDDSITSVHLLSPDCRNPDSMGIVQSPVAHSTNEEQRVLPGSADETETQTGINFQAVKRNMFSAVTSSPLNSNSARDNDTPSVETASDSRGLTVESRSLLTEKVDNCDNSANDTSPESTSRNDIPVFRFNSDHCYAGVPRKMDIASGSVENEDMIQSEGEEAQTPLGSTSELSQDSGYEDVTQSPEVQQPAASSLEEPIVEKTSSVKNLVPVLVSVNSNGCLTVHDTDLTKTLGGQVFLPENVKLITGTSLTSVSQAPLILSPVTVGRTACPLLTEAPKLSKSKPESIIEILSQKKAEMSSVMDSQEISPPKYGKFRIGTFASFSNTSADLEPSAKLNLPVKLQNEEKPNKVSQVRNQSNNGKNGKSSPVVDTLGTLVQKVKSSLSPASYVELNSVDHIQHDHDYCTKNLMPSVVNTFLEARLLSKDTSKGKVTHVKGKKSELDNKHESKSSKRKRHSSTVTKEDISEDYDVDSESDTLSIPDSLRPKYRHEPKHTDPKVKITGSSDFQDQFVYFMNTKKRSRRRESKDMPLPSVTDRVFIPPKPGDIVVPHLTDQDIENLKIRSKQSKHPPGTSCSNSLRTEFMAAKLSNGVFPAVQLTENVDDEKNIINTILSLENEDLVPSVQSEPPSYNESMELYGQGLNADLMNLLPEQMNLTPEQMDLLYSAVDEVQNSSPGLVGAEKLVSAETSSSAFQFPIETLEDSGVACTTTITECVPETEDTLEDSQPKLDTCNDEANITEPSAAENDGKAVADITRSPEKSESPECDSDHKQSKENTKKCVEIEEGNTEDEKCDLKLQDRKIDSGAQDTRNILSTYSEIPAISTQNLTLDDSEVNDESKKPDNQVVPTAEVNVEKSLFQSPNIDTGSVAPTLVSDISLQQIDKSLDLLGSDFRLDKGELFQVGTVPSTTPVPVVQPSAQVDYNAPWIVTVSMYWNDLPAIMSNNQPFVRLVDIHKQILPAKDTGILKKRCQLMGIVVENCSEMQRYFLVQYGRAFNSKSTLIISKDNAKVLIGYYVDPQPKTARPEDHHKSIIDHRREQLRRIALARRAAMRTQRLGEKKDEVDPRKIKEPQNELGTVQPSPSSMEEQLKKIEVPKVTSSLQHTALALTHEGRPQRATRHKKINFLELLRGDTSSHTGEEESVNENLTKSKGHHTAAEEKKKNTMKERKVKVVKYSIETDSSEETDSVMSDYSLESDDSDSSRSEIQVWKKTVKQKVCPSFATKVKSKIKGISKSYNKGSLKVKFGLKRSKPAATSTPVAIQVINKPTAVPKLVSAYRSKLTQKSRKKLSTKKPPVTLRTKNMLSTKSSVSKKVDQNDEIENDPRAVSDFENSASGLLNVKSNDTNETETNYEQNLNSLSAVTTETELGVSPPSPKQISETDEIPRSKSGSPQLKLVESVNIQTDSCSFENDDDTNLDTCNLNSTNSENNLESSLPIIESGAEGNSRKFDLIGLKNKPHSSTSVENSVSLMKRKNTVHIRDDETPIRIIHQDSSPQTAHRTRSQLGEVFVNHYHNKKSTCVRCYTCRKMMSVDNFLHHLHDVSGGLLSVILPRTIDLSEPDLNESETKLWESFLRKKELFDNNQLPSPDIVGDNMICNVSEDSTSSFEDNTNTSQPGPRIITTPVSPVKREKIIRHNKTAGTNNLNLISSQTLSHVNAYKKQTTPSDANEGVRTSSRKRKVKHLYGFEDYSFTKFPRLMKNAVVEDKNNQIT